MAQATAFPGTTEPAFPPANDSLRTATFDADSTQNSDQYVFASAAMKTVLAHAKRVAATNATVLILGETGTGKEILARVIHTNSDRAEKQLVRVNCASLPATLIESELFGHEKGAFTGANERRIGRFETARGATLFLDEIGELPLPLQSKLLRVLQEGEFERIGSSQTIKVDFRVIAASNRDLADAVRRGEFRADLYYRLNIYPITIPALRDRTSDLLPLVEQFLRTAGQRLAKTFQPVDREVIESLASYTWPGNVRELENVIERAAIGSTGGSTLRLPIGWNAASERASVISPRQAEGVSPRVGGPPFCTLRDLERQHILSVLEHTHWRIEGPRGAAVILDIHPSTLRFRIQKLGLDRREESPSQDRS